MSRPADHRLSGPVQVAVGVLLAVPILALLLVPIYARKGPELWGFPFFYWYQFVWVLVCGGFTGAAYHLIERNRGRRRGSASGTPRGVPDDGGAGTGSRR